MDLYEKTLSEESIFKCSFMELVKQKVKLPDGNEVERDIVKHSNGVCVLAFNEKGNILMVEQFRKPFNRIFLELPAGKVDKEEILEKAALRELKEETGYSANKITYLGQITPSPGFCDEDEFLNLKEYSLEEVKNMIIEGKIIDAKTIACLFFYENIK
ncbi:NUDIX domain-containing protein [Clostridium perfringens]